MSAMVRIPFMNMLMRQESELFENLSKAQDKAVMVEEKSEILHREFTLRRQLSGRGQKEEVAGTVGQCRPEEGSVSGDSEGQPEQLRIKSAVERLTHQRGAIIADGTVVGLPFISHQARVFCVQ